MDASAFVADEEDDMVSVRTSGQLVLDELLRNADGAAGILAGAVRRRMDEAAQAKVLPCRCCSPACSAPSGGAEYGKGNPVRCQIRLLVCVQWHPHADSVSHARAHCAFLKL